MLLRYGLWQRVSFWLLSVLYLKLSVAPCSLEGQLKQFNVFVFGQRVTSSTYEEASYFNGLVEWRDPQLLLPFYSNWSMTREQSQRPNKSWLLLIGWKYVAVAVTLNELPSLLPYFLIERNSYVKTRQHNIWPKKSACRLTQVLFGWAIFFCLKCNSLVIFLHFNVNQHHILATNGSWNHLMLSIIATILVQYHLHSFQFGANVERLDFPIVVLKLNWNEKDKTIWYWHV